MDSNLVEIDESRILISNFSTKSVTNTTTNNLLAKADSNIDEITDMVCTISCNKEEDTLYVHAAVFQVEDKVRFREAFP